MGDLDCGDCDCKCDDCNCDCKCDDCGDCDCKCDDCNCLDGCCTGETNVILCCFLPASNNTRPDRNRSSTPTDCSFCCCCFRDVRNVTSPKSSKKKKRKGFWSCFRSEPSPPSSPPRAQPITENVPPMGYAQDGRYPMKDGLDNVPPMGYNYNHDGRYPMNVDQFPLGYKDRYSKRASWEELGMPPRELTMDGKWSRPVKHGDKYGGHL